MLCDKCRDAHDPYWALAEAAMIDEARLRLEARGYVVLPKDRIETLGAQHFETYWAYMSMRDQSGYREHVHKQLGHMIGGELVASGRLPMIEGPGPSNLDGYVFRTFLNIIKPKEQHDNETEGGRPHQVD